MPKITVLATLLLTLTAGSTLSASTPNTGSKPWDDAGESAVAVTGSLKATVQAVPEVGKIVLLDEDGREHRLALTEDVEIVARSKKHFGGRKQLSFRDLTAGQKIKLTFLADSGKVVQIKVLEPAEAAA